MLNKAMHMAEENYSRSSSNVHDRRDDDDYDDDENESYNEDDDDESKKEEDDDSDKSKVDKESDEEEDASDSGDEKKKKKKEKKTKGTTKSKRNELRKNLIGRRVHTISQMWGEGSIERNESRYKIVKFKFFQNNVWKEMKMCFSHTDDGAHMQVYVQSLLLKLDGDEVPATSLQKMIPNALNMAMKDYIKGMKLKNGNSGKVVSGDYIDFSKNSDLNKEPTDTLIVQAVYMTNICTTSKGPVCIDVKGIGDQFMEEHHASWDVSNTHFAILTSTSNPGYLHENVYTAFPNLAAIHGIHKQPTTCAKDISLWGDLKDNNVLMKMPSAYFIWLMYNLIELIKAYIVKDGPSAVQNTSKKHKKLSDKSADKIDQSKLPRDITKQQWTKLLKLHKKYGQIDIYKHNANLSDNYIGKIIKILKPPKDSSQLTWNVSEEDPKYRVPLEFAKFAAPNYDQTVQTVSLSESNDIRFSATRGNLPSHVKNNNNNNNNNMITDDDVFITMRIAAFRPSMLFYIREVEKSTPAE